MKIASPAFVHKGDIPEKYSCDGENVNPELIITDAPGVTKSFALIMDDPDAPRGTFTHWLIWNISPKMRSIPEAAERIGTEGTNSGGRIGYFGPCPPPGPSHTYRFKLYALDAILGLESVSDVAQLEKAMEGHIIGKAELDGEFRR